MKIEKKWEQDPNYLLMTFDASSLQARLATIDTALNRNGIDPVLYALYEENSKLGEDLHSSTSFAVFGESINLEIFEFVDENGKSWPCGDNQKIIVKRDGKDIIVTGKEVVPTDIIVDYYDDKKK